MMSEKHGVPGSQKEGEQTALALTLPGASSSSKCCLPGTSARAFSSSETLCNVWKGGTPAQPVGVCWGRRALCLPPRLPGSPHIPAWPISLFPFTSVVDAGSLSVLAPLRPTSFYRPVALSPWASATPSGFGGPGSAPSSDSKADAGPSCCWKGKSVGSGWLFSIFSKMKKKKKLFFCFFTSKHSIVLAQALQFPVDKAGQLSKPLGAGGEATSTHCARPQRRSLSPQPGAGCPGPGRGWEEGEGKGAQRAVVRGTECLFDDSPKVAEGERLWPPTGVQRACSAASLESAQIHPGNPGARARTAGL